MLLTSFYQITEVRMGFGPAKLEQAICEYFIAEENCFRSIDWVVNRADWGARFYTDVTGTSRAYAVVVKEPGKHPYLKTIPDQYVRNNLLHLPGGPLYASGLLGV